MFFQCLFTTNEGVDKKAKRVKIDAAQLQLDMQTEVSVLENFPLYTPHISLFTFFLLISEVTIHNMHHYFL
jgi:hypothetical protein